MQNRRKTLEDGISSVNLWWLIEEVRGCNNKQVFLFGNQDMTWWTTQQQGFLQSRSESSMIINRKEKAPLLTQTLKKKHWLIDNWRRHTKITKRSWLKLLTKNPKPLLHWRLLSYFPKASTSVAWFFAWRLRPPTSSCGARIFYQIGLGRGSESGGSAGHREATTPVKKRKF